MLIILKLWSRLSRSRSKWDVTELLLQFFTLALEWTHNLGWESRVLLILLDERNGWLHVSWEISFLWTYLRCIFWMLSNLIILLRRKTTFRERWHWRNCIKWSDSNRMFWDRWYHWRYCVERSNSDGLNVIWDSFFNFILAWNNLWDAAQSLRNQFRLDAFIDLSHDLLNFERLVHVNDVERLSLLLSLLLLVHLHQHLFL
jgi:hypothetical protein